jgi:hypothetical protein
MWALATANAQEGEEFWTRLNYGLAAVKEKRVCVVDDYWTHVVHLALPTVPQGQTFVVSNNATGCEGRCPEMEIVIQATRHLVTSMQATISAMIDRVSDILPDVASASSPGRRRPTRALDFLGDFSSWAFGTATSKQVSEVKDMITKVEIMAETAAADASRTREGLATFTKLSNERIDKLHDVLKIQQKSLGQLYREILDTAAQVQDEYSTITYLAIEMAKYVSVHDTVQLLELGVEDLVHGQLTPRLVDANTLTAALSNITRLLRGQSKEPCYSTAREIYESRNFDYARRGLDLFIWIKIPYTRLQKLNLYRLHTFPVSVPGDQGLVTQLKDMPKYILGESARTMIGELIEEPKQPVVDTEQVRWHDSVHRSCLSELWQDRPKGVAELCDFAVRRKTIEPTYLRLGKGRYVVSNLTDIHSSCNGEPHTPSTGSTCAPCLITLSCGCSLSTNEAVLSAARSDCESRNATVDVLHSVNLAVLQSFYDLANVSLTGNKLNKPASLREAQPLKLPFFGDGTAKLLAADESTSYSLRRLTDSLKNDTIILHTPAEAVLKELLSHPLMTGRPDWSNWLSWATFAPWAAIALLAAAQYHHNRKLQALVIAAGLEASSRLAKTYAYSLKTTPTPTNPPSPLEWLAEIASIRRFDYFLTTIVALLVVVVCALVWAVVRARARQTFLYVNMTTADLVAQLYYHTLPDPTRAFTVITPKQPTRMSLTSFGIFGILTFDSKPWKLQHAHTRERIRLPSIIYVSPWKLKRVQQILDVATHTITPLIVHTHAMEGRQNIQPPAATTAAGSPPGYIY